LVLALAVPAAARGKIFACSTTRLSLARLFSFLFELEDRLVRNEKLPSDCPIARRDLALNTGHFKSIGGVINNWYVQAVKFDPACCASRKATRVQEERLAHRVSSDAFKLKYSFNVATMDVEALLTRVYEGFASVPALRLEQDLKFDVRNMFEVKPHTDVTVAPPGDQRPWMDVTNESQVLMLFQTYGKNEGINITRGHVDPVPITNLRGPGGSMLLPIATAIIMLMEAHGHLVATNCAPPPPRCPIRFSRRYFAIPKANPALYANATLT
jgi:hypothetical protein